MPPPTQRWIAPVGDGERADRQREVEVAVRLDRARARPSTRRGRPARARAIRSSAAIFGAPVTEPPGSTAVEHLGERRRPRAAAPSTVATRCVTPASSRSASSSGQRTRARLADAREVVPLEVDDHHVLGRVLRRLDRHAGGPRALDRRRAQQRRRAARARAPATRRRSSSRRPTSGRGSSGRSGASARASAARVAVERRREVLDEIHLVDVALGDRGAHRLDRRRVLRVAPGRAASRRSRTRPARTSASARRLDRVRDQRQRARLRRRRRRVAPQRVGERRSRRRRRATTSSRSKKPSAASARLELRERRRARRSHADGPRGVPQPVDAELEVVDRHALVGRVDELRRQLGRHRARREEAVRDGAERLAQPVAVGEARACRSAPRRAPGSISATNDSTASQSGVSSAERVPPCASSRTRGRSRRRRRAPRGRRLDLLRASGPAAAGSRR